MKNIYKGKTVLITGNTGFKGSWMAQWLQIMGAKVIGYSLSPQTSPNHFEILNLDYYTYISDINNLEKLIKVVNTHNPDIVFHLAAQPLVRYSYINPIETYQTNVMGTLNILEACKINGKVSAIVIVTTDKCYENIEQKTGYKETDKMGGFDPYSSSKGCAEILTSSFRNSFFHNEKFNISHQTLVATARAGNVIGGGDWSQDRLIPDIIRAALNNNVSEIRNPQATRPWQHVLEPISGYLELGKRLMQGDIEFAQGWNFGPEEKDCLSVTEVLDKAKSSWSKINYRINGEGSNLHEAKLLSLNIDKAKHKLNWFPNWTNDLAIEKTISWYKSFYIEGKVNTISDLNLYIKTLNISYAL